MTLVRYRAVDRMSSMGAMSCASARTAASMTAAPRRSPRMAASAWRARTTVGATLPTAMRTSATGLVGSSIFSAPARHTFEIACAQLCGLGHYSMRGYATVHTQEEFDALLVAEGEKLSSEDSVWN